MYKNKNALKIRLTTGKEVKIDSAFSHFLFQEIDKMTLKDCDSVEYKVIPRRRLEADSGFIGVVEISFAISQIPLDSIRDVLRNALFGYYAANLRLKKHKDNIV